MASNFTNFLLKLGEDPQLLEKFKQNPDSAMDDAGLTPAEKALLLSGNVPLIRTAILNDPGHREALGISPDQTLSAFLAPIVHPTPTNSES